MEAVIALGFNPLINILGHDLLAKTGFTSVKDLVIHKGIELASQELHTLATHRADAHVARIAADMVRDKWRVGLPYPKHPGRIIKEADMPHDAFYRITKEFVPRGGFIIDQIRDAIDMGVSATLISGVPTGDPTPEWVRSVAEAGVDWVFLNFKLPGT